MDPTLRQLRALLAVVDEGTFTDAGIELGLSQAAVSRAVAGLESALGAQLLRRTTRSLETTPTGQRVVSRARRVVEEVDALRREAAPHAPLHLGYAWAGLGRHTTAVQRRWASDHAGQPLVLVQSVSRTAGLAEGRVDVAVLRRTPPEGHCTTAVVGHEPRHAAMAADDPLARRRSVVLADVAGRPLVADLRTGSTTLDLWPPDGGPSELREVNGVDEWLTAVAAGGAIGITPEATVDQHRRSGVTYRRVRDAPAVTVLLAHRRGGPPPQWDDLVALVRETYARGCASPAG